MLTDAFDTITRLNVWEYFDQEPPKDKGYMYGGEKVPNDILNNLKTTKQMHSGCSWASTLRHMQYIRQEGWDRYVETVNQQHS